MQGKAGHGVGRVNDRADQAAGEQDLVDRTDPGDQAKEHARADPLHTRVGEEIGDVLVYLLALADSLGIDAAAAAIGKIDAAEGRFPAQDFHGRAPEKG